MTSQEEESVRQELQQQIREIGGKVDELRQTIELRGKLMTADTRSRAEKELASLKQKLAAAEASYDEFREDAGGAWQEFKAGVSAAWNDLSEACDRALKTYQGEDKADQ